jgi:hypothetical protein
MDHQLEYKMGIRNLLAIGYIQDREHRTLHQGRNVKTLTKFKGNLTYAASYPEASTGVKRIGMQKRI